MRALRNLNRRWIMFEDSDVGRRVTGLMTPLTIAIAFAVLGWVCWTYYRQVRQELTDLRTLLLEQQKANNAQQKSINELLDAAATPHSPTRSPETVPPTPTP